ncbi:MAG: hypothetical protein ABSD49_11810 [Candidatus Bathyarchaeia archaeon]
MKIRKNLVTRFWYYFRIGYGTYLTFLLGFVSTLITVYYLAIKNLPYLLDLFPHFETFAILATVIGAPVSVAIGWLHLKRSHAYGSEADITVESNPYSYKLTPGKEAEAFAPSYLETLKLVSKLLKSQNLLSKEDESRIDALENKLQTLIEGNMVGNPRRKM